ncbi:DUF1403 family protein [Roseovarius sp. THAF8]|uniref:DUF1403 family protein n=1 Tax=Roseovarius sp. THAF8 TaxID=2587846 RepID=UPI0020C7DF77|nr:DUF1403 family protein [Roseovarius sp. THAF8]
MTYHHATISNDLATLPQLTGWVSAGRAETLETVVFRSGAALTVLDQLVGDPRHGVPMRLLANRLTLRATTATSKLEGRLAREADIRDAYHLTGLAQILWRAFSSLRGPFARRRRGFGSRAMNGV